MMACNTITNYLKFRWVGEILFSNEYVAITYDKERKNYEIAYLTDRRDQHGRVRCVPFKDFTRIDDAFETAKADGALHCAEIAHAIAEIK